MHSNNGIKYVLSIIAILTLSTLKSVNILSDIENGIG